MIAVPRQPRALFGNAAFSTVAGSELVILELAEELMSRGWACDLTAWIFGAPMRDLAAKAGMKIIDDTEQIEAFSYDLVWMQNRIEPVLKYGEPPDEAAQTLFAFAHLDSKWKLAQPGVIYESVLGQMFVVTSERAVDRVVQKGLPLEAVRMSRNAAPATFEMSPPKSGDTPRSLLIVSNHPPAEVLEAAEILRGYGVLVNHWGSGGDVQDQRLMPADVAKADAILTIGKTVPYALRARRAVYVYDHFGGPGWLSNSSFASAAERNFSGLCCERHLDAATIAAEIMDGFRDAAAVASTHSHEVLRPFHLEAFVDHLITNVASARTPSEHRQRLAPHTMALMAESTLCSGLSHYFVAALRAHAAHLAAKAATAAAKASH